MRLGLGFHGAGLGSHGEILAGGIGRGGGGGAHLAGGGQGLFGGEAAGDGYFDAAADGVEFAVGTHFVIEFNSAGEGAGGGEVGGFVGADVAVARREPRNFGPVLRRQLFPATNLAHGIDRIHSLPAPRGKNSRRHTGIGGNGGRVKGNAECGMPSAESWRRSIVLVLCLLLENVKTSKTRAFRAEADVEYGDSPQLVLSGLQHSGTPALRGPEKIPCHQSRAMLPCLTKVAYIEQLLMDLDDKFAAIRKGLLEFILLKIIAADKVYAADILKQLSSTEFATQEGTLYPLLSKMRRDGLLDYDWKESEAGPPRKYYELTAKGREQLRETSEYWQKISGTVRNLGRN